MPDRKFFAPNLFPKTEPTIEDLRLIHRLNDRVLRFDEVERLLHEQEPRRRRGQAALDELVLNAAINHDPIRDIIDRAPIPPPPPPLPDVAMAQPAAAPGRLRGAAQELLEFVREIRPIMNAAGKNDYFTKPTYYNNNRVKSMFLTKKPFYIDGKKAYLMQPKPQFIVPATEQYGGQPVAYLFQSRPGVTEEETKKYIKLYRQYGRRLKWKVRKNIKFQRRRMYKKKRYYPRRRSYGGYRKRYYGGFRKRFGGYRRRRWY